MADSRPPLPWPGSCLACKGLLDLKGKPDQGDRPAVKAQSVCRDRRACQDLRGLADFGDRQGQRPSLSRQVRKVIWLVAFFSQLVVAHQVLSQPQ